MTLSLASTNDKLLWLSDEHREYGIHMVANRGSGKSRFLGRYLAFADFLRGVPTVIFDKGSTIDNFLDKVSRLPPELRKKLWSRIRYVDLAGLDGYVVPFPLYYRLGPDDDPLTVADRFVQTIIKTDPNLANASVQGKGAIEDVAQPIGVELVQRGWQVTELDRLTHNIPPTLRVKLIPFVHSQTQRAIYGASTPGIDWQKVIDNKEIVLLDYRRLEKPQFAIIWALSYFLAFIRHRGLYQTPISIIIDELKAFKAGQSTSSDVFFDDMDVLVNTTMREHNLWLTLAHQSMAQFDDRVGEVLMSMNTQILGTAGSRRSATQIAQELTKVDPLKIKRTRNVYGNDPYYAKSTHSIPTPSYFVIEEEPVEFTAGEQIREVAEKIYELKPFTFIMRVRGEDEVQRFSIAHIEKDIYPDKNLLPEIRKKLMQRDGRKITDVLAEIAARTAQPSQQLPAAPSQSSTIPVTTKGKFKRP